MARAHDSRSSSELLAYPMGRRWEAEVLPDRALKLRKFRATFGYDSESSAIRCPHSYRRLLTLVFAESSIDKLDHIAK